MLEAGAHGGRIVREAQGKWWGSIKGVCTKGRELQGTSAVSRGDVVQPEERSYMQQAVKGRVLLVAVDLTSAHACTARCRWPRKPQLMIRVSPTQLPDAARRHAVSYR